MATKDIILRAYGCVILGILLMFFFTPSLGQVQTTNHLEIRGQSQMKAIPDEVTCLLRNRVIRQEYDDVLKALDRQLKEVKKVLVKLNFPETQIKSKNFSVGPNRVYQRGTSKDSGFVARQDLEITFEFNKEKVLDLINEISDSKAQPSLSFGFDFMDKTRQALESQLIKAAIADAHGKANLIAEAAGVRLGPIRRILYDPAPVFQPQVMAMAERSMARDDRMEFGGFEVPELELTRSIIIEWVIE